MERQRKSVKLGSSKQTVSTSAYKLKPEYTDLFSNYFNKMNPQCILTFHRRRLRGKDQGENVAFLKAYANCKRKDCTAHYVFTVRSEPLDEDNVPVTVK